MLEEKGFFATGTVRENRTAKCPIEDNKAISKKERGSYSCAFDPNLEVLVVRWNDNSVVTVMTNMCEVLPVAQAKPYTRKEHKEVLMPQPRVIYDYNKYMGGVDLHDNGIANYRIAIRGKKWWWPLFTNVIYSMIENAWKIYNIANETQISQLEFRWQLTLTLLKFNGQAEQSDALSCETMTNPSHGRPSKTALTEDRI
ncbi:DDE Tnp 1 7 domain containing protein [Asbolus verrucosus]|uniref:DDE Tnp 1 7 domain containing protein n=1 Tax=Asbolus verrucosus TaxID=1661398 RepID=A0A482VE57_ASBVE|nr:DDE Tnp 1 7 domain containing protein [Asbolus verrucosus]